MGFPTDIKEKALVASGRRCCVCKRFKGRDIEVHHIIPASEGGPDTFDNAIPLCFDCHSQAGHYNAKHSRGTKYSKDELRKHRDNFYKFIETNSIDIKDYKYSQFYLITSNHDIVKEILIGDYSQIPYNGISLIQNSVAKFFIKYLAEHERNSCSSISNPQYANIAEYKQIHNGNLLEENSYGRVSYYRFPKIEEVVNNISQHYLLVRYLLQNGSEHFVKACFNEHGCGGESNYDSYVLPNEKYIFYVFQNNSSSDIIVRGYNAGVPTKFVVNYAPDDNSISFDTPEYRVKSGNSVMIPIGICVEHSTSTNGIWEATYAEPARSGECQLIYYAKTALIENESFIGNIEFVKNIRLQVEGLETCLNTRPPNIASAIRLDRSWECGCCPHIFIKDNNNKYRYLGELFDGYPEQYYNIKKYIYKENKEILIAELEDELTIIDQILVNDKSFGSCSLKKGETFTIHLNPQTDSNIEITGKYIQFDNVKYELNNRVKINKVNAALTSLNKISLQLSI